MKLLLGLLILVGCVSAPSVRQPLIEQEIRVRPDGFSNQICVKRNAKDECEQKDTVIYDLSDQATRDRLIEVKMICNVGGKRFRVCAKAPCLYSSKTNVVKFLGIVIRRELVVDETITMPEGLQELLDKKTYCAPLGSVSERGMQWN